MGRHFKPLLDELQANHTRHFTTNILLYFSMGRVLAGIAILGAMLVLTAYALDAERIWRPIDGGPATSPLTALLVILGGASILFIQAYRVPAISIVLASLAGGLALFRLGEIFGGSNFIEHYRYFDAIMAREAAAGTPVSTGWNTAEVFVLLALSLILRKGHRPRLAQIAAMFALCFPLTALAGYSYGAEDFYGEMSLTTVLLTTALGLSVLLLSARTGLIRAIVSPSDVGRFSRREILIITAGIYIGGYVIQLLSDADQMRGIPVFAIVASLLTVVTIGYFAVTLEVNDQRRRRAERRVSRLSTRDPLTGLFNRRFLSNKALALVSFAREQQCKLCILMIDIDHFKSVNDTYGHAAGDDVIKQVSHAVLARIRGSDFAVRYGGEEILACLLNVGYADAMRVAEDLRSFVEEMEFPSVKGRDITISIGCAEVRSDLDDAIHRADTALYAAKQGGRNRVCGDQEQTAVQPIASSSAA